MIKLIKLKSLKGKNQEQKVLKNLRVDRKMFIEIREKLDA